MKELLDQLDLKPGVSQSAIDNLQRNLEIALPDDFLDFLRRSNGAIGHGPDLFAILEPAERILETTVGYGAAEYCPGLIVVGGDGCGNVIGIDGRSRDPNRMEYVVLDPAWLDLESESCQHRSKTLVGILQYLASC